MTEKDHIAVCICTYKRADWLRKLLMALQQQKTDGQFNYSLVVVDNDASQSARQVTEATAQESTIPIRYHVEPEQNIALARNMAVAHAAADFVAFIDDDEIPIDEWLLRLREALLRYQAAGVLGPMKPLFESEPARWIIRSCFTRPSHATGFVVDWKHQATGNVLIRRSVLDAVDGPFRKEFGRGGEDVDFFRRAIEGGHVFIWCEEAVVHEVIAPGRTRLSFQLKRALLRGRASVVGPGGAPLGLLKSALACAVYTALLPAFVLAGRHVFATYLIKTFDHLGKLLAASGIDVIKEKYVSVHNSDAAPTSPRQG